MMLNIFSTIVIASMLGVVLYFSDVSLMGTILWPLIIAVQAVSWYHRGKATAYQEQVELLDYLRREAT